jgi:hypothetical protein
MTARRKDVPVFGAKYEQAIEGQSSPPSTSIKPCFDEAIWRLHRAGELTGVVAEVGEPAKLQFDIERVAVRLQPKLKTLKAGTELWYDAATVVSYAFFHVACMQNNADAAINAAFDLGLLVGEAAVQKVYGGAIDFTSEQADRLRDANTAKAQKAERDARDFQAAANRHWDKNRKLTRSAVAKRVADETGISPRTIRRLINYPK